MISLDFKLVEALIAHYINCPRIIKEALKNHLVLKKLLLNYTILSNIFLEYYMGFFVIAMTESAWKTDFKLRGVGVSRS